MTQKTNGTIQKTQKLRHIQGEGPNWVLIFGGALLSTLSVRLGCRIKQAFEARRQDSVRRKEEKRKSAAMGAGACQSHTHLYCFNHGADASYQCLSGMSGGGVDMKQPESPMSREAEVSLSLVQISAAEPSKENGGVMWTSSSDRLEPPRKPFHRSNSSGSPCISESGSDIYSKREVIQKLRQQLKRRDEMIMEMQSQITNLQNSISIQMARCTHLQSQVDATNRDLFASEREIQRLRKVIAEHYAAGLGSPDKAARNWPHDNCLVNGYPDSVDDLELHCIGVEKGKGDGEKVEMLKREIGDLKEVIEGKDFLLQSYKEQKVELCSKVKELQQKLASQVPNIL